MQWRVLIPVKPPEVAKSRLQGATRTAARHEELVRAIQLDSISAVVRARQAGTSIVGIHVVTATAVDGLPLGVESFTDAGDGLNAALTEAARSLGGSHPGDAIVALVADLPALRSADLLDVLREAEPHGRAFVPDHAGSGTTLLTARPGLELRPFFGVESAARHRSSGAVELAAGASVRSDVDTAADLERCLVLGVGEHTAQLVSHLI